MLYDWLTLIGVTFGALLPIANPFSTAPVFVAITRQMSHAHRWQQARLAAIYMAAVLLVSLLAGALILEFFGISLPALRIAGGLVIARIGFSMLNPEPEEKLPEEDQKEALDKRDIAFTPIAMPMLSGPGSIAVTISMATSVTRPRDYLAVGIGILIVAFLSWLVLRSSTRIVDFLGSTGVNVLTRIMGLILVCIGIQFIATGIFELVTDPGVVKAIYEAYPD
ncbi:MAG: MarC family NAAT transporter [Gammaproteobacteria bacterium]|nr:MarC family NAAT transporter [Gammaproteobacteria bacterium]